MIRNRMAEFTFEREAVEVRKYPYKPSIAYLKNILHARDVQEVDGDSIWLKDRDIVYLPYKHKDTLAQWAKDNAIPVRRRYDLVALILQPFLDTEFTAKDMQHSYRILRLHGIPPEACDAYRARFQDIMWEYNITSMLWEWCYLGITDLLDAHLGILVSDKYRVSEDRFEKLYWELIAIQRRASIVGAP